MSLGMHDPTWRKLVVRLDVLATRAGAENAVVADAWNDLWCRARAHDEEGKRHAFNLLDTALAKATKPLPRGGRIDVVNADASPFYLALSFAGVYVLILWFNAPFDGAMARALARRALPDIERLTVALPPPDGPDHDALSDRKR